MLECSHESHRFEDSTSPGFASREKLDSLRRASREQPDTSSLAWRPHGLDG
jgi:hypothetical protein